MRQAGPPKIADYASIRQRAQVGQKISSGSTSLPKVSIVTAVRNGEETLSRTIDSIRNQTYPNIEYIVVDGVSTDRTLPIILNNLDVISRWISEPDRGIYDAFNKGVALSTGQFIGFLNADDAYSLNQIEEAVATLERTGCLWAFGDTWMYGYYGEDIFLRGDPDYYRVVRLNMPSIQQITLLSHRAIFDIVGLFRTTYRIAADYDWLIRVALAGIRGAYNPAIIGHMWAGGISTRNQKLSIRESFLISVRNGHPLLEACLFWWMRYRFIKHGPPPEFKEKIDAIRNRLQRVFGSAAAAPPGMLLWEDLAANASTEPPRANTASVFAAGRHAGIVMKESALLYLAQLGRGFKTYAIIGAGAGAQQAEAIFSLLYLERVVPGQAEVLVITELAGHLLPWKRMKARYLAVIGDVEGIGVVPGCSILGALPGLLVLRRRND